MVPKIVTFNNNKPVIGWITAPVAVAFVTYLTYGDVFGQEPWAVAVWLIFSASAIWMLFRPRVSMTVTPDGIVVLEKVAVVLAGVALCHGGPV